LRRSSHLARAGPELQDLHGELELIPRHHGAPEARAVDPGEVHELLRARRKVVEQEHRARLRHRLDDQDAGHDGSAWEVPLEGRLVHGDVLERDDPLLALHLEDAIHEEERVAMREAVEDLANVHQTSSFRRIASRASIRALSARTSARSSGIFLLATALLF